ncbi:hypothetical protein BV25DRAFT_1781515, partial [Artomyces pyxidatus]
LPVEPFLLCSFVIAAVLHVISGLAHSDSHFLLLGLRAAVVGAVVFNRPNVPPGEIEKLRAGLSSSMPGDIRTILSRFELEPDIVLYACC